MFALQALLLAVSLALLSIQASATIGATREINETLRLCREARKEIERDDDDDDNWWRV